MIIGNAKLFLDGAFQEGSLTFENGVITAVGPAQGPCDLDAGGKYLVPGFLDVHTHGAMNEDFSDGRPEGLPIMSRHYAAHGVTSFLATTMTLKEETLTPAMHAIRHPPGGSLPVLRQAGRPGGGEPARAGRFHVPPPQ